jgi:hypothetical protein
MTINLAALKVNGKLEVIQGLLGGVYVGTALCHTRSRDRITVR